jgi:hypothetical protein
LASGPLTREHVLGEWIGNEFGIRDPQRHWHVAETERGQRERRYLLQDRVRTDVTEVLLLEREEPPDDGSRFSRAWRSLPFDRHRD